ncbi:MAG: sulfur carrier protein ThiS [Candidatus Amulumruptor caecigallinarius]|nr:sulfur carrier protein ThiS [Candidatus Amulumruptor caecigallinarius]
MRITFNDEQINLPDDITTLSGLLEYKGVKTSGTAVAQNNRIVPRSQWNVRELSELDSIVVITGAFGG